MTTDTQNTIPVLPGAFQRLRTWTSGVRGIKILAVVMFLVAARIFIPAAWIMYRSYSIFGSLGFGFFPHVFYPTFCALFAGIWLFFVALLLWFDRSRRIGLVLCRMTLIFLIGATIITAYLLYAPFTDNWVQWISYAPLCAVFFLYACLPGIRKAAGPAHKGIWKWLLLAFYILVGLVMAYILWDVGTIAVTGFSSSLD